MKRYGKVSLVLSFGMGFGLCEDLNVKQKIYSESSESY